MMESYKQLLTYIKSNVTRNLSENVITSLIDYVSSTDHLILPEFYETTLKALLDAKNDRFWFKTNLKVGKLRFEREEFDELEKVFPLPLSFSISLFIYSIGLHLSRFSVT